MIIHIFNHKSYLEEPPTVIVKYSSHEGVISGPIPRAKCYLRSEKTFLFIYEEPSLTESKRDFLIQIKSSKESN